MKFSIITVSLNSGERLKTTLNSIFSQTCQDYEVIVKDGGSTDGSVDALKNAGNASYTKVRFYREKDTGIYDAMNQAVQYASGEYVIFLNCGDVFADEKVLEHTAEAIENSRLSGQNRENDSCEKEAGAASERKIFYGDTYGEKRDVVIASAPEITGFTCYRNIPCHQSCFYSRQLCLDKPYDLQYKIRADYDHFLWCFYRGQAQFIHMGFAVSSYEGGGFSEKKENQQLDTREHKQITSTYMGKGELLKYKAIMAVTLAPLRRRMAESEAFAGIYHKIKEKMYR